MNGLGELKPEEILQKQMPWLPDESEMDLVNVYLCKADCDYNFNSEIRDRKHQEMIDRKSERKLKKLQIQVENFDRSINGGSILEEENDDTAIMPNASSSKSSAG